MWFSTLLIGTFLALAPFAVPTVYQDEADPPKKEEKLSPEIEFLSKNPEARYPLKLEYIKKITDDVTEKGVQYNIVVRPANPPDKIAAAQKKAKKLPFGYSATIMMQKGSKSTKLQKGNVTLFLVNDEGKIAARVSATAKNACAT